MGYLFRKRIKLFPGVGFNLSKRGIRTTFGGKGLTIAIKDDEMMTNDNLPDRGLDLSYRATPPNPDNLASRSISLMGWALLFLALLEGIVLWLRD
jgi:hypothetical protein